MRILFILVAIALMGCDDIFEKDISTSSVEVVAPIDGVAIPEGEVSFVWREMQGVTGYRLTVVSPTFDKAAIVFADTLLVVDSLHTGLRCNLMMTRGDYQWSLQAKNFGYKSAETINSFKVLPPNP